MPHRNGKKFFIFEEPSIVNIEDNTLYSTSTYNLVTTLNQDFFLSGISDDGSLIFGTNNNPMSSNSTFHEKK
jgi:hypothetical protein